MISGSGIALVARMISVTQLSDVVHSSAIATIEMRTRDMQMVVESITRAPGATSESSESSEMSSSREEERRLLPRFFLPRVEEAPVELDPASEGGPFRLGGGRSGAAGLSSLSKYMLTSRASLLLTLGIAAVIEV